MKWSAREMVLAWLTLAVILGGVTFLLGDAKRAEWNRLREERRKKEK